MVRYMRCHRVQPLSLPSGSITLTPALHGVVSTKNPGHPNNSGNRHFADPPLGFSCLSNSKSRKFCEGLGFVRKTAHMACKYALSVFHRGNENAEMPSASGQPPWAGWDVPAIVEHFVNLTELGSGGGETLPYARPQYPVTSSARCNAHFLG